MTLPTVGVVVGTRPEAIKMAPLIRELEEHRAVLRTLVISTGQHREMLDQILGPFAIDVDHEMSLMEPGQSLHRLTAKALAAFDELLAREPLAMLLAQGDTTTAFAASLAAFYRRVPVGHVEAGLRTGDKGNPFPEEVNRRLISVVADLHFAPTRRSMDVLLAEHIPRESIHLTGNTVIDALLAALKLGRSSLPPDCDPQGRRLVLVTAHRRESFGQPLEQIFLALRDLAEQHGDALIVYPVHLNPNVQEPARRILGGVENVRLTAPLDYFAFVELMSRAQLILTDSGGVQEEAPSLGVPVLVLRNETERVEALAAGTVQLVGTTRERIVEAANRVLDGAIAPPSGVNPYGDGLASRRIARVLLERLGLPIGRYLDLPELPG